MELEFPAGVAIVGLLLVGAAVASGLSQRSVLSIAVLSLAAGAGLAAADVVAVEPGAESVVVIVELVLLLTLFSDGLSVERELVQRRWRPAVRALIVALPLNAIVLAVLAKLLFGVLSWGEAFLLGFLLSPTDPVVTSSVVASPRVPRLVRHTLNMESGLNDGLALPFVLFFLALVTGSEESVAESVGGLAVETLLGLGLGAGIALLAGLIIGRLPEWALADRYEALFALGLGLSCFGVTELLGGNGLVAAFVGGLVFAVAHEEVRDVFLHSNEDVAGVLQVIAFAVFGALVVATGWDGSVLPLLAFIALAILVVRPATVLLAFLGIRMSWPERLFVAWFGPKGIASMLFALFVLNSTAPDRTLVFDIASFTILASILAHGLTDTVAAGWIERELARRTDLESPDLAEASGTRG